MVRKQVRKQVDVQAIANGVAGRPVRISWSDNKAIRANHASYSIFLRHIWVSSVFKDAPDEVVRCLIAHELGHMEDKLLHTLTAVGSAALLLWCGLFLSGTIPLVSGLEFVLMAVGFCALIVLRFQWPIPWEARADRWAEKAVGKDFYWSTKATIFEWADR